VEPVDVLGLRSRKPPVPLRELNRLRLGVVARQGRRGPPQPGALARVALEWRVRCRLQLAVAARPEARARPRREPRELRVHQRLAAAVEAARQQLAAAVEAAVPQLAVAVEAAHLRLEAAAERVRLRLAAAAEEELQLVAAAGARLPGAD
jgi:hypothetical protein